MVFDSFGIAFSRFRWNTKSQEKGNHGFMSVSRVFRDLLARVGRENSLVRLSGNQSFPCQPPYRFAYSNVAHTKVRGQIYRPGSTLRSNQILDQFEVILGVLSAVIIARSLETVRHKGIRGGNLLVSIVTSLGNAKLWGSAMIE
jgi:hypothetical protein